VAEHLGRLDGPPVIPVDRRWTAGPPGLFRHSWVGGLGALTSADLGFGLAALQREEGAVVGLEDEDREALAEHGMALLPETGRPPGPISRSGGRLAALAYPKSHLFQAHRNPDGRRATA
jgi:hypothetical protein